MIRDGKKLPLNVLDKIPEAIQAVKLRSEVVALYTFGSAAKNDLKPLSDLDFAILLPSKMDKHQRFEKHLELIGLFNQIFHTDEIDLAILNDSSLRFCYTIIKTGKLLFCRNRSGIVDLHDKVIKNYLDFKYFRDSFDKSFLKGIGYNG